MLDDDPVAQDDHVIGERPHHFQIVADEQVGEIVPPLQLAQEIDDLRLHRHVERARRLVEHDEFGLEHQRPGDGDALPLAARELVRIALHGLGIEPDLDERLAHSCPALFRIEAALDGEPLLDDLQDRQPRAERAVRVLEHDLHVLAQRPHVACVEVLDVAAEVDDRALRRDEPQQRQAERGLARTRFADHAQRLSGAHLDRHAVHRLDMADDPPEEPALDRKPDFEVVGGQHDRRLGVGRGRSALGLGVEQLPGIGMFRRWRIPSAVSPASTIWPRCITQTSSAMWRTMPRSWVISSSAIPNSFCRSWRSLRICACTVTSSAVVGSSAMSRSGLLASAMAIITRWRWPPDS